MKTVEISLCGITFKASNEWLFVPTENFILARHDAQIGILRITLARNRRAQPLSSQALLDMAIRFVSPAPLPAPFDVKMSPLNTSFYGAASYKIKEKKRNYLTRVMSLAREDNLVFAFYGCRWKDRHKPLAHRELQQAEMLVQSITFQHPE